MRTIDGSQGEGGGQILRTSLALSAICNQPITIQNIRANRKKPGLRPQHLTGVQAMASLCQAEVEGAELNSAELTFSPQRMPAGNHRIDIGTAGATSLLLHALYFPMACGPKGGELTLLGGTHNDMAPTFHYLQEVWLPWMQQCGFQASLGLSRYGFYPKGGGQIEAQIPTQMQHDASPKPLEWMQRPPLDRLVVHGIFGQPESEKTREDIPRRMVQAAAKALRRKGYNPETYCEVVPSSSSGAVCHIFGYFGSIRAGFTAFGRRGKSSESVGKEAARDALLFLKSSACLEEHIADQVLLPLALARQPATYTTTTLSGHLETNAAIIQMFLPELSIEFQDHSQGVQVTLSFPSESPE